GIQIGPKKARCKVIWSANARSVRKGQAGIQLLMSAECPWMALLPHGNSEPSQRVSSQRRWDRHKISILITLQHECASVPIRLTATDISPGGCYIETLSPFPIGFSLSTELWLGGEKVKTHAVVRTSDPRLGMGLEFVGLKVEDQKRFQQGLEAIDPF